ncbi:MAG: hypothetical protein KDD10_24785, partial [Phaeodactylibacter sp.]|nr:hypothetical protein [Phaeodactylibacter sp.]
MLKALYSVFSSTNSLNLFKTIYIFGAKSKEAGGIGDFHHIFDIIIQYFNASVFKSTSYERPRSSRD